MMRVHGPAVRRLQQQRLCPDATTELEKHAAEFVAQGGVRRVDGDRSRQLGDPAALRGAGVEQCGDFGRIERTRSRGIWLPLPVEHTESHALAATDPLAVEPLLLETVEPHGRKAAASQRLDHDLSTQALALHPVALLATGQREERNHVAP